MEWTLIYKNAGERGHHDQGAPEVTLFDGTCLFWLEDPDLEGVLDRPEMDVKDAQHHSEVYEGRYSGSGMFQDTTGRLFLATDRIYVQNGRLVRGSVAYMQELRGTQGGGRLGIVDGDGPFVGAFERPPSDEDAFAAGATWGEWYNWQKPEKTWTTLETPQIVPTRGWVRLVLRFNLDYAAWGGFHYDVLTVEQRTGEEPPPTNGVDYDRIRTIVREELDRTRLGA